MVNGLNGLRERKVRSTDMTARVLLVDANTASRIVITVKLSAACHAVTQTATGAEALAAARTGPPDIILAELTLPDMTGLDLCRRLRDDPATRHIPLLFLTASPDAALRCAALRAGADGLVSKPVGEAVLLALIRSHLRDRSHAMTDGLPGAARSVLGLAEDAAPFAAQRPRRGERQGLAPAVALVGPDAATAEGWRARLSPHLDEPAAVLSRVEALARTGDSAPDLYLVAANLEVEGDGLRLLSELRARPASRNAAVVVALAGANDLLGAMALDLGAADLVHCDFPPEETALRLRQHLARKRAADRLRAGVREGLSMAMTDPLTGLHNRRYALAELERMVTGRRRPSDPADGGPLAVMMIDLDRFKAVNDRHGHAVGDRVLAEVARRLRRSVRPGDLAARIGGEEFLVAGHALTADEAQDLAERVRRTIGELPVPIADGAEVTVTASVGLALHGAWETDVSARTAPQTVARLLDAADRALLRAKAVGRDRVEVTGRPQTGAAEPPRLAGAG